MSRAWLDRPPTRRRPRRNRGNRPDNVNRIITLIRARRPDPMTQQLNEHDYWRGDPADLIAGPYIPPGAVIAEWRRALPDWRNQAACHDHPLAMFFPAQGEPTRPAQTICAGCPVRQPCLADALDDPDAIAGVRGGLSPSQRRRLRAILSSQPPPDLPSPGELCEPDSDPPPDFLVARPPDLPNPGSSIYDIPQGVR